MNKASSETPRRILIALSIMLAAVSPVPRLGAQTPSRNSPAAQSPRGPVMKFAVRADGSKNEIIVLNNPCARRHLFKLSTGARFLRFLQEVNALKIEGAKPVRISVLLDATGLKEGVYADTVFVECLDCKDDTKCRQTGSEFKIELTVSAPFSPTQTATPQPPDNRAEMEKLSLEGPDIPVGFNRHDFSFRAFVRGGWPVFFEYELTRPATVTLTVSVEGFRPMTYDFPGMQAGLHAESLNLPAAFGGLGVATYSVKAAAGSPPGTGGPEFFVLRSLSVGRQAVSSPGLAAVTFRPNVVPVIAGRASKMADYSFRAIRTFSGGAAAYIQRVEGLSSVRAGFQSFDRRLRAGETVRGTWDCTQGAGPSLGLHQLLVKAWFTTRDGDGSFALAESSSLVLVRR